MAYKKQPQRQNSRSNQPNAPKKHYFSQKPNKADYKSLMEKIESGALFLHDALAGAGDDDRITVFYDSEESTWVCFWNIGVPPGFSGECVVTGRGKNPFKALALAAYWLTSVSDLETLFPFAKEETDTVDW